MGNAVGMNLDNDWYGHRKILSDYCNVVNKPVFATLLHGWVWNLGAKRGMRRIESAPYLLWNYRNLAQGRKQGIPNVDAIGAPFAYLCKLKEKSPYNISPKGTLFFPQHFTGYYNFKTRHNEILSNIEKNYPGPYAVSLFYLDPNFQEVKNFYESMGWKVFCAGSRSSGDFLNNLYECISSYSFIVSNDFSSSIFYAAFLGKNVGILKQYLWENSIFFSIKNDYELEKLSEALFEGVYGQEARKIGSKELGVELMLTPEELKRNIGRTSPWKSFAAHLIANMVDFKYGKAFRAGDKDL